MKKVFSNLENTVQAFSNGNYEARNSSGNVYASGKTLYSYGSHFPMAIDMGSYYLINGDRYSNTTSKHQSECIHRLTPNVQIPFSALTGANIFPEDIKLIDHKADTWQEEEYTDNDGERKTRDVHFLGGVLFEYNDNQYLSGFDSQESLSRRSYFLTRIAGKFETYDDAIESLKPIEVKYAIESGIDVKRQGEYFFIPRDIKTRELSKVSNLVGKMHPIFPESTHIATEVRETSEGARVVRGTVRHRPGEFRTPQHGILKLGKQWHIPIKNTALESYQATGLVD